MKRFAQTALPGTRVSLHDSTQGVPDFSSLIEKPEENSARPISRAQSLLESKSTQQTYEQLRRGLTQIVNCTEQDIAAKIIQSNFRKFRTRQRFLRFLKQYKTMHEKTFTPYFFALAMLINISPERRKKYFTLINRRLVWGRKLSTGHYQLNYEQFNIIGMYTIPDIIEPDTLASFVKKMFASSLRNILSEWHIAARKSKIRKEILENFQLRTANRKLKRLIAVPFNVWRAYTYRRSPLLFNSNYPEWGHYHETQAAEKRLFDSANNHYRKSLIRRIAQALRNRIRCVEVQKAALDEADQFRLKQCMIFALKGWMKYLAKQKEQQSQMRHALMRWFRLVQSKKHVIAMSELFDARHKMYQKRAAFTSLMQNRRREQICEAQAYVKIQRKPSFALAVANELRGDSHGAALCRSFHSWLMLIRKRKLWQQFVFSNIFYTEYDNTRAKTLSSLLPKHGIQQRPFGFIMPQFQNQTYDIYRGVVAGKSPAEDAYLLVEGETAQTVEKMLRSAKSNRQRREVFFEAWKMVRQDTSLLMRIALLNRARRQHNLARDKETPEESMKRTLIQGGRTMESIGAAAVEKFEAVMKAIHVNYKSTLSNRIWITRRDAIIIESHRSHHKAIDYNKVRSDFLIRDSNMSSEIEKATNEIHSRFKTNIPIEAVGKAMNVPNNPQFLKPPTMRSRIPSWEKKINKIHEKINKDLSRSEIAKELNNRYERLLGSTAAAKAARAIRNNNRIETFNEDTVEANPRPKTGVSERLKTAFPSGQRGRRLRAAVDSNYKPPVEVEKTDEKSDENAVLPKASSKGNFFKSLSGFQNMLKETSRIICEKAKIDIHENKEINIDNEEEDFLEEEEEELYEMEEEYVPVFKETKPKKKNQQTKARQIIKTAQDSEPIREGFSEGILQSANAAGPIGDPKVNQKYRQFLDILFGKAGKESANNFQLNAIKRKIISEYKTRKLGGIGMSTKGITMGVSSLVDKYNYDRKHKKDEDDESRLKRAKKDQKNLEDGPSEYECKYNSLRYRFNTRAQSKHSGGGTPGTSGSHKRPSTQKSEHHSKHEEGEEGDQQSQDYESSSDSDMDNLFGREDFQDEDINKPLPPSTRNDVNKEEDTSRSKENEFDENKSSSNDDDIDAAAADEPSSDEMEPYVPGNQMKPPKIPARKVLNDQALIAVNKVVFRIVAEEINDDGDEPVKLVDVDPDLLPSLDLTNIVTDEKPKETPAKTPSITKPATSKRQRRVPLRSGKPSVVVDQRETVTPEMARTLIEDENITKVILDNGQTRLIHGKPTFNRSFVKPRPLRYQGIHDEGAHFPVENQVVSFCGGGRQTGTTRPNFTQVRIQNKNTRGITKPLFAASSLAASPPSKHIATNNNYGSKSALKSPTRTHSISSIGTAGSNNSIGNQSTKSNQKNMKHVIYDLVALMASHNGSENMRSFKSFSHRVRSMKTKTAKNSQNDRPQTAGSTASMEELKTTEFYLRVQSIFVLYTKHKDVAQTSSELIRIAVDNPAFLRVLQDTVERVVSENDNRERQKRMERKKELTQHGDVKQLASQYVELDWLDEIPSYNAVAVQFGDQEENGDFRAIISRTGPRTSTGGRKPRARTVVEQHPTWDDLIEGFTLDEMMLVTPCVVPENVVDSVISHYH